MKKYKVGFHYKRGRCSTFVSEICVMVQGTWEGSFEEEHIEAELRAIKQNIAEMKFRGNFRGDSLMMIIEDKTLLVYNRARTEIALTIIFEPIK